MLTRKRLAISLFALPPCAVAFPAFATGPDFSSLFVKSYYFVGGILALGVIIMAVAALIFGPAYLARPSKKHRGKMENLSPEKKRLHRTLHWVAGIAIGGLAIVFLGVLVYLFLFAL